MLAIWAEEATRLAFVVSAHMSCEVCLTREGTGAEGTLEAKVGEEWRHDLGVVMAIVFPTEGLVFK